jgi:hypothetical protein
MDEYDVFLDDIARETTLKLLITYVNSGDQKNRQFMILTPHQVNNVVTTKEVKIIQMPEPVRVSAHGLQQQTL